MKKSIKWIAGAIVTAALFASCGSKNPVADKKMSLEAGEMSFVYVFTDSQFWLEGMDGLKFNYRYAKTTTVSFIRTLTVLKRLSR